MNWITRALPHTNTTQIITANYKTNVYSKMFKLCLKRMIDGNAQHWDNLIMLPTDSSWTAGPILGCCPSSLTLGISNHPEFLTSS